MYRTKEAFVWRNKKGQRCTERKRIKNTTKIHKRDENNREKDISKKWERFILSQTTKQIEMLSGLENRKKIHWTGQCELNLCLQINDSHGKSGYNALSITPFHYRSSMNVTIYK